MSGALTVAKTNLGARSSSGGAKKSVVAGSKKPSVADSYKRLRNRIALGATHAKEGISETICVVETQGTIALSGFAAGYFGPSKMRLFAKETPFGDVRLLAGVGLTGWGLLQAFDGSMKAGGMASNHALAIGNGLVGSIVYEVSHNAGLELAVKRAKNPATRAAAGTRSRIEGTRPVLVSGEHEVGADYGTASQVGRTGRARRW